MPAGPGRRRAAGTQPSSRPPSTPQPQRRAGVADDRVAAATAASPHAATAANTPSADTATQIAAGASTRNGATRRATSSAPRRPQRDQHGHRRRAADQGDHQRRWRRRRRARRATRPTKSSSAPGGWPATWVAQLPGAPAGIRSTKPRSMAGTSWIVRAVGRYSLWFDDLVGQPRPAVHERQRERPRQPSRRTSSAAARRHESLAASAEALPDAERRRGPAATGVPGADARPRRSRPAVRTAGPGAGSRARSSARAGGTTTPRRSGGPRPPARSRARGRSGRLAPGPG